MYNELINKAIIQLEAIEKVVDEVYEIPKQNEDLGSISVRVVILYLIERKLIEEGIDREVRGKSEKSTLFAPVNIVEISDLIMEKVPFAKQIYDSLYVENKGHDGAGILSSIPGVLYYLTGQMKKENRLDPVHMVTLKLNMVLVTLCIALESFCRDILKEFYLTIWQGEIDKNEKLSFMELKALNDLDSAKSYIVDKHLDKLFRYSFAYWFEYISQKLQIKNDAFDIAQIKGELIELYQRRNIHVHADGIVNTIYIECVPEEFRAGANLGDRSYVDRGYITAKIKAVENCIWYVCYHYVLLKCRGKNTVFDEINPIMLEYLERDCKAFECIYKTFITDPKVTGIDKLLAEFNLSLYYKLAGEEDKLHDSFKGFESSMYSDQYLMAKAILLEEDLAFHYVKKYFDKQDNDDFMFAYDWKLISLIRNKSPYKEYFHDRIIQILTADQSMEE